MLIADCSPSHRSRIRAALLRWYDRNKRDLPWRRTRDPYAIWISETMLQQTQVATVVPYYLRFMERFSSVQALDRAPLRSVLSLWSGLGYYRRAENLKAAAHAVVKVHAGHLPCDYRALRDLPGIGHYTACALMSIAFQKPYAAVDGNARRVYSRLFGLSSAKESDDAARLILSRRRPGDYTQAVMELGSSVCVPSAPSCAHCPVAHWCSARCSGAFDTLQRRRLEARPLEWPVVCVESNRSLLLHRRPRKGLLAGLWELPTPRVLTEQFECLRSRLGRRDPVAVIRHTITNHRIKAPVYVLHTETRFHAPSWMWVPLPALSSYPLSSLSTKAIRIFLRTLNVRSGNPVTPGPGPFSAPARVR